MPDWIIGLAFQIPLVAAVTYAFLSGRVHSDAELKRREKEHTAELSRQKEQALDWRKLYEQERLDRIAAAERLSGAVDTIRDIVSGVDELTREVIRATK